MEVRLPYYTSLTWGGKAPHLSHPVISVAILAQAILVKSLELAAHTSLVQCFAAISP